MRAAFAAAAFSLALAGCVPTMRFKPGPDHDRLVSMVRQFCEAERSADPFDTAALFADSVAGMLDSLPGPNDGSRRQLTSADTSAGCEPGRTWYLGGSRMFAEVRIGNRSDRLDVWRGDPLRIQNILYGKSRRVGGRKADNLREALAIESSALGSSPVPPPPPPDPDCFPGNYHFTFLATGTSVYRQGATVKITPTIDISPAGTRDVALKCVSDWSIVGPARLSEDRRSFTIEPDAAPGEAIRVGFTHAGKPVTAEFRVVGRDEIVLTGRYSQRALTGCHASEPVRELEFSPGNRFSVTFTPFETYRDYWGSYAFDPATKKLKLTVEGGNYQPPGLDLEGEADLADGSLVLRDLFLGDRAGGFQTGCTYTF